MKTDKAIRNEIHTALKHRLSSVVEQPDSQQKMLRLIRGEEKSMKKKLSAGFALAMALALTVGAAFAVVSITATGRLMAQTEQESGDYINWPTAKKVQVVVELMDEGYVTESGELKQLRDGTLTDTEAARIADSAIEAMTGEPARNATFLSIMSAAWGPFEQWTQEEQAWYSQALADVGATTAGKTCYAAPTGKMTKEEAIAIAKKEIARGFSMEDGLIDKYRVYDASYQIPEFAKSGDQKAYWYVAMDTLGTELAEQEGLPHAIDVFVDPDTGLLLEPIEDKAAAWKAAADRSSSAVATAVRTFITAAGEEKTFPHWSLENKARWSDEIAPLIRAFLAERPEEAEAVFSRDALASADFRYAMPDEDAIPQEEALTIAREALQSTCQLSDEEIALLFDTGIPYYTCVFYDVTDEAQPMWKFLLIMPTAYDSDEAIAGRVQELYGENDYDRLYKVEVNARTGEVVRVVKLRSVPDSLEVYQDML